MTRVPAEPLPPRPSRRTAPFPPGPAPRFPGTLCNLVFSRPEFCVLSGSYAGERSGCSLLLTIKNSGFSALNESRARTRPTPVTRNNASRVRNAQQVLRDLCRTEEHDSEQRVAGRGQSPSGRRDLPDRGPRVPPGTRPRLPPRVACSRPGGSAAGSRRVCRFFNTVDFHSLVLHLGLEVLQECHPG